MAPIDARPISLLLQLLTWVPFSHVFTSSPAELNSEWKACHSEFFTTWSQIHVSLSVFINEQAVSRKWAGIQTNWTNGYSLFIKDLCRPFCFVCPAFKTSLPCRHHSKYLDRSSVGSGFSFLSILVTFHSFLVWIVIPWAFVFNFCYR